MKKLIVLLILLSAAAAGAYFVYFRPPAPLLLTGIVTTNDVAVSPQVGGQVSQLLVTEGDEVKKDQLIAVIRPDELQADSAYYSQSAAGLSAQVDASLAALRFEPLQTTDQI